MYEVRGTSWVSPVTNASQGFGMFHGIREDRGGLRARRRAEILNEERTMNEIFNYETCMGLLIALGIGLAVALYKRRKREEQKKRDYEMYTMMRRAMNAKRR